MKIYRLQIFDYNCQGDPLFEYHCKFGKINREILEEKAAALNRWEKRLKKYETLHRSDNMASDAQLRMIEGIWREICYHDNDEFAKKSLRKFLKSKFKVDDVMFLTKTKACKVIQALQAIKKNLKIKKSAATL